MVPRGQARPRRSGVGVAASVGGHRKIEPERRTVSGKERGFLPVGLPGGSMTQVPMSTDRPTMVRWRILGLLLGLSFVSYVVRLNLSIAAPFVTSELGISAVQMGGVFSAFVWGYAIFQLPVRTLRG